jgi:GTPase involved in cell partitioning and DNA repair
MEQEKTTIQAAAKALGVTTKTIQRYLLNGTLSKIKEGTRTYILIDEIRTLRQGHEQGQKRDVQTNHKDRDRNIITLNLAEYKELLQELGHYKGQFEGQTRHLLEYKQDAERKAQELTEARAVISKARSELEKMVEFKKDAEQKAKMVINQQAALETKERELAEIKAENERLRLPFWKRWFNK